MIPSIIQRWVSKLLTPRRYSPKLLPTLPSPPGSNDHTFTGTTSWQCPAGITSVVVKGIGGGGGGAAGSPGAGGGAFYTATITVVPGLWYTMHQGQGGAAGANDGTPTTVYRQASYLGALTLLFSADYGQSNNQGGLTSNCFGAGGSGHNGGSSGFGHTNGGAGATASAVGADNSVVAAGVNPGDGGASSGGFGVGYAGANGSLIVTY